ncbi:MAG: metallophosphoesterase [Chitinophagaceae bacterium]|nr:metallophosphoesterase [Chitinophagaceae bacterium]
MQFEIFGIYGSTLLKNHKLYPSPGNHDYANNSGNKSSRSMPYHQNFTVPQNGEAGGVASNHQNYYSYNVGNIHFLSLDSYGTESDGTSIETSGGSALKTWIDADLAANTSKWIVAYWHHPPYTKRKP